MQIAAPRGGLSDAPRRGTVPGEEGGGSFHPRPPPTEALTFPQPPRLAPPLPAGCARFPAKGTLDILPAGTPAS